MYKDEGNVKIGDPSTYKINYRSNKTTEKNCTTCVKSDVCSIQEEFSKAVRDITDISAKTNAFIETDIACKKWHGEIVVYRS